MSRPLIKSSAEHRDDVMDAIARCNRIGHQLHAGSELQREQLDLLEQQIRFITAYPHLRGIDTDKLLAHIETCHRLRNAQELGGFTIQIMEAMQKAYQRMA